MKVLLLHNRYGSGAPSGENVAVDAERRLLERGGVAVEAHERSGDELRASGWRGVLRGALATPANPFAARRVQRLIERGRHDVVHLHNFFPLLSPSVLRAARRAGAATVFTMHNARIFCAAGVPLREGAPCTLCLDRRSALPGLRHRCYRGSLAATVPLAAMIALHRALGTWEREVDAFVAFTPFQRALMAGAGVPEERIHLHPPPYPDAPQPVPFGQRARKAVFVGRLGVEKGLDLLLGAWAAWGESAPLLEIVGEGPAGEALRAGARAAGLAGKVSFTGLLPFPDAQRRLADARLVLMPSRCFEGYPMSLREAMALGVPMAGARLGAIPGVIDEGVTGVLFEPGSPEALLAAVRGIWGDVPRLAAMAEAARAAFVARSGEEAALARLLGIYRAAVSARRVG